MPIALALHLTGLCAVGALALGAWLGSLAVSAFRAS